MSKETIISFPLKTKDDNDNNNIKEKSEIREMNDRKIKITKHKKLKIDRIFVS